MDYPEFSRVFIDGRKISTEFGDVILECRQIGKLAVSTGKIVACDPFVAPETKPFTLAIPPSTYPIVLSLAHMGDDQRVAYAKLQISDKETVRWEMALLPEQDINTLKEDEMFCYGVDSGTGCFMDTEAAKILSQKMYEDDSYIHILMKGLEKNYVDTWSWIDVCMNPANKVNLIAFSSGFGDGVYPSFFGFDKNGDVASLVTDFGLFEDEEISP